MIYLRENWIVGTDAYFLLRYPTNPEGYYTVETLRLAIQDTLNGPDTVLPGAYVVTYNVLTARFEFSNGATTFSDSFALDTKGSLENQK